MTFSRLRVPPRADDFARLLFASARQDAVPLASRHRVGLALGIGPDAAPGGALAPSPGGSAARAGGSEPVPGASAGGSAAPAGASRAVMRAGHGKLAWLGTSARVGLAGGAIALGVAFLDGSVPARESRPAVRESPRAEPELDTTARAASLPASTQTPSSPAATRTSAVEGEPGVAMAAPRAVPFVPPRAAPRRVAKPGAASATPAGSAARAIGATAADGGGSRLLAEVRRLDAARHALATGHASQALAELQRYQREFPAGTLAQDAELLEVRALDRSGQRAAAQRRARELSSRPGAERHRAELEAIVNPLASGSRARRLDIEEAR